MICDNCKTERLITDFINNQKYCYRCEYQKKMEKTPENRTMKSLKCRICEKEFFIKKDVKKRQRTVFCSHECALKGHKETTKNYWTRKVCVNPSLKIVGNTSYPNHWKHGL